MATSSSGFSLPPRSSMSSYQPYSQRLTSRLPLTPTALLLSSEKHRLVLLQRRRPAFCMRLGAMDGSQGVVVPRSVPVRVAHELLQAGHRYLDIRTVDEFSAGHAVGATNIPYMFKVGSAQAQAFKGFKIEASSWMAKNPNFLEEVSAVFQKDDEIIIGCQSGRRSLMAATDLSSAGFTGITDIAGGYAAWVQNRLPTNQ